MCSTAAHDENMRGVWINGSKGCFRPGQHVALENVKIIPMLDLVSIYAPDVVMDPFAHSYVELWEAIADQKSPISSANRGLEALGIVFAALESAMIGQPVKINEIISGERHAYEDTVIDEMKQNLRGKNVFEITLISPNRVPDSLWDYWVHRSNKSLFHYKLGCFILTTAILYFKN